MAKLRFTALQGRTRAKKFGLPDCTGAATCAGNTLIASHIWITKTIAKKYQEEADLDDLVQEGTFGFYKALHKFDPESDGRFSTVAYRAVKWAIKDYLEKLRQLQRHESSYEITDKGGSDALGLYRSVSVERKILFD